MNPIREISLTVRNAAFVTVAVILGFCAGSALGLPVWLQTFFLLPAVYLFCQLAGERRPSLWKLVGFAVLLSGLVLLFPLGSKYVPERYFWIYLILVAFAPFGPALRWIERRFIGKTDKSEAVGRNLP